jgi:hypothetical protein
MEHSAALHTQKQEQQEISKVTSRLPPIIVTSLVNLLKFQGDIKVIA